MRLDEEQAYRIYEKASNLFTYREHLLTSRDANELLWGTDRMQRRVLHLLRRAEKRREKRVRAERNKRVRPIVRLVIPTVTYFPYQEDGLDPRIEVRVGDDLQIYVPEAVWRAKEEIRQREDDYDDFLLEEVADRDAEQVLLDDDFGNRWWEYENDSMDHEDIGDSYDDGL